MMTREQTIDEAVRRQIGTVDRLDGLSGIEITEALWNLPSFRPFRNKDIADVRAEFCRIRGAAMQAPFVHKHTDIGGSRTKAYQGVSGAIPLCAGELP